MVTKETLRKFQMAPVNPKRDRSLRAVDVNEGEGRGVGLTVMARRRVVVIVRVTKGGGDSEGDGGVKIGNEQG